MLTDERSKLRRTRRVSENVVIGNMLRISGCGVVFHLHSPDEKLSNNAIVVLDLGQRIEPKTLRRPGRRGISIFGVSSTSRLLPRNLHRSSPGSSIVICPYLT